MLMDCVETHYLCYAQVKRSEGEAFVETMKGAQGPELNGCICLSASELSNIRTSVSSICMAS